VVELEDDVAPSRRKTLWIGLAVLVVLIGVGALLLLGKSKSDRAIPEATVATANVPLPEASTASPEPATPASTAKKPKNEKRPEVKDRAESEAPKAAANPNPETKTGPKKPEPKVASTPTKPEPPPEPDPADKKVEKVFLTSRPSGAKVTLDGRSVGKTPVEVEIRGKAKVVLSLDGYMPLEKLVRLADVQGTVNFQLQAASSSSGSSVGMLFLSSSPAGAEILYQGKVIGKTPKMVELPAGNRTLNLRSGALSQTIQLEIKEGQNPARHVPL